MLRKMRMQATPMAFNLKQAEQELFENLILKHLRRLIQKESDCVKT